MNERIRELARQAYIEARLDENPKWRESFVSEAAMNEIQSTMKKFAELIVQECIDKIGEEYKNALDDVREDWDRGFLGGLSCAMKTVQKHFGVEE